MRSYRLATIKNIPLIPSFSGIYNHIYINEKMRSYCIFNLVSNFIRVRILFFFFSQRPGSWELWSIPTFLWLIEFVPSVIRSSEKNDKGLIFVKANVGEEKKEKEFFFFNTVPAPGKFLTPRASRPSSLWALRGQPFTKGAVTEFPPHPISWPGAKAGPLILRIIGTSTESLLWTEEHSYFQKQFKRRRFPLGRLFTRVEKGSHLRQMSYQGWSYRRHEKREGRKRRERGRKKKGGGAKKESSGLGPWNKALSQGQWNKWNKSLIQTNTGRTWILLWIKPESVGRLSNQSRMKSFLECWIWHQVDLGGQCALSQLWGLGEEGSHGLPWAHLSSGGHTGGCGVPGIPVSCFPIHHLAVVKHFLSPLWVSVFTSKK